jgi:hypothetical protein
MFFCCPGSQQVPFGMAMSIQVVHGVDVMRAKDGYTRMRPAAAARFRARCSNGIWVLCLGVEYSSVAKFKYDDITEVAQAAL